MGSTIQNKNTKQLFGLILGPVIAFNLLFFFNLSPGNPLVTCTAAIASLMAIWWITEAIPIPVTALLPIILFPMLGVMKGKIVASTYCGFFVKILF